MTLHFNDDLFKVTTEESGNITVELTAEVRDKLGLPAYTPCIEVIPTFEDDRLGVKPLKILSF